MNCLAGRGTSIVHASDLPVMRVICLSRSDLPVMRVTLRVGVTGIVHAGGAQLSSWRRKRRGVARKPGREVEAEVEAGWEEASPRLAG